MSSSLCSLYKSDKVMYSYSLNFLRLRSQILNGSHDVIDRNDNFINFRIECHAHYDYIRSSHAFIIYNVVLDGIFCHMLPIVTVMFSMEMFLVEIRKMIRKRTEMNFAGKQIKVFNNGTIMYIIQSCLITLRHSFMISTSVFIWFNDRDNIFLTSTLEEQFIIYEVASVVSILLGNLLLVLVMNKP